MSIASEAVPQDAHSTLNFYDVNVPIASDILVHAYTL